MPDSDVRRVFVETREAVSALFGAELAAGLVLKSSCPQDGRFLAMDHARHGPPAFYDHESDTVMLDDTRVAYHIRSGASALRHVPVAGVIRSILCHELIHAAQRAQLTARGAGAACNLQALDLACEGHARMAMARHAQALGLDPDVLRLVNPPKRTSSGFSCLEDSMRDVRLYVTYELAGEVAEACEASGKRDILAVAAAIEPLYGRLFTPTLRAVAMTADSTRAGRSLRAALSQVACGGTEQQTGPIEASVVAMSAAEVAGLFCPQAIRAFAQDMEVRWAIVATACTPSAPRTPTTEVFLAELDSALAAVGLCKAASDFLAGSGLLVRGDPPSPEPPFRAVNYPSAGVRLYFGVEGPYACGVFSREGRWSEVGSAELARTALGMALLLAQSHPADEEDLQ
jgi:hypothetical protein